MDGQDKTGGMGEKPEAYLMGYRAKSILENPFWKEYPKPSSLGREDEDKGRLFVDGWCDKWKKTS